MKEIQQKIKDFCNEHKMESPIEYRALDTMSELGELAKEMLKMSNYGRKPVEYSEELKLELGDVLFSLMTIANTLNIDLDDALRKVLDKYERRLKKGSAGSEND
jgi:NTP pyrophosphatase (non-canonical NTP hydrolase)